jgi:ATP-dependent Clp protease ATP-binding subunit ClpC
VFERFTERARQVVVFAQEEARTLRHNYIGTEHLLLGLLREGGAAARALEPFDVTYEEVQAQVARIVGQGDEITPGQIPFTPRAKKVLELSLREALNNGDNDIGPEHILLGLLREGDGVGARILTDHAPLEEIVFAAFRQAKRGRKGRGFEPELQTPQGAWSPRLWSMPRRAASYGPSTMVWPLLVGWGLFGVALGVGVLIGWAIWG